MDGNKKGTPGISICKCGRCSGYSSKNGVFCSYCGCLPASHILAKSIVRKLLNTDSSNPSLSKRADKAETKFTDAEKQKPYSKSDKKYSDTTASHSQKPVLNTNHPDFKMVETQSAPCMVNPTSRSEYTGINANVKAPEGNMFGLHDDTARKEDDHKGKEPPSVVPDSPMKTQSTTDSLQDYITQTMSLIAQTSSIEPGTKESGTNMIDITSVIPPSLHITDRTCLRLSEGHLPYYVINNIKPLIQGVYKIAYNGAAIFVGNTSTNVIVQLRNHFTGYGQHEFYRFFTDLKKKEKDLVTVFWVDAGYKHQCGCSYQKCIERIQGSKPMFNIRKRRTYPEANYSSFGMVSLSGTERNSTSGANPSADQPMLKKGRASLPFDVKDTANDITQVLHPSTSGIRHGLVDYSKEGISPRSAEYIAQYGNVPGPQGSTSFQTIDDWNIVNKIIAESLGDSTTTHSSASYGQVCFPEIMKSNPAISDETTTSYSAKEVVSSQPLQSSAAACLKSRHENGEHNIQNSASLIGTGAVGSVEYRSVDVPVSRNPQAPSQQVFERSEFKNDKKEYSKKENFKDKHFPNDLRTNRTSDDRESKQGVNTGLDHLHPILLDEVTETGESIHQRTENKLLSLNEGSGITSNNNFPKPKKDGSYKEEKDSSMTKHASPETGDKTPKTKKIQDSSAVSVMKFDKSVKPQVVHMHNRKDETKGKQKYEMKPGKDSGVLLQKRSVELALLRQDNGNNVTGRKPEKELKRKINSEGLLKNINVDSALPKHDHQGLVTKKPRKDKTFVPEFDMKSDTMTSGSKPKKDGSYKGKEELPMLKTTHTLSETGKASTAKTPKTKNIQDSPQVSTMTKANKTVKADVTSKKQKMDHGNKGTDKKTENELKRKINSEGLLKNINVDSPKRDHQGLVKKKPRKNKSFVPEFDMKSDNMMSGSKPKQDGSYKGKEELPMLKTTHPLSETGKASTAKTPKTKTIQDSPQVSTMITANKTVKADVTSKKQKMDHGNNVTGRKPENELKRKINSEGLLKNISLDSALPKYDYQKMMTKKTSDDKLSASQQSSRYSIKSKNDFKQGEKMAYMLKNKPEHIKLPKQDQQEKMFHQPRKEVSPRISSEGSPSGRRVSETMTTSYQPSKVKNYKEKEECLDPEYRVTSSESGTSSANRILSFFKGLTSSWFRK